MSRSTRHFLDLLDVELKDVCDDLREFESVLSARSKAADITAYVYQQNTALLEREIAGVTRLRERVRQYAFDPAADAEICASVIIELLQNEIRHHQLPEALHVLLKRRIGKILEFMKHCDHEP